MASYQNVKDYRVRLKIALVEASGGKCQVCGLVDDCYSIYDFHHLNPADKLFNLSSVNTVMQKEKMAEEAKKCILVCSNCHRKITLGYYQLQGDMLIPL